MPLMHNLPGVVGFPKIHAKTPPSINAELGGLSWECLPNLHDFIFLKYSLTPYIMLYCLSFSPSPGKMKSW